MEAKIDLSSISTNELSAKQTSTSKVVVVCRGRSCRKYDAAAVYQRFKQLLPPNIELIAVPCLGQCGNGAMVLVEPDRIWYFQVHPDEVIKVVQQHLMGNSPVKAMLYPKFHSTQSG